MVSPDLYISLDIEADGPIPGPYSMLSFGLAVAGRFDGQSFESVDPQSNTFYRELMPISTNSDTDALKVSGLDRKTLESDGLHPQQAMSEANEWISSVAQDHRPVLVGYPLLFDWMFFYWYVQRFASDSPLSFSSGLDMKTIYQQKARVPLDLAGKDDLPSFLRSSKPHTHNALDDAIEQADLFAKLAQWNGLPNSSSDLS